MLSKLVTLLLVLLGSLVYAAHVLPRNGWRREINVHWPVASLDAVHNYIVHNYTRMDLPELLHQVEYIDIRRIGYAGPYSVENDPGTFKTITYSLTSFSLTTVCYTLHIRSEGEEVKSLMGVFSLCGYS